MKKIIYSYSRQSINNLDILSVVKALKSDYLTSGPLVKKFEKDLSIITKSKFSVALNSATSALHVACMALEIKKKNIVWVSSVSFVATANCAAYCGANIDFIDIDFNTRSKIVFLLNFFIDFVPPPIRVDRPPANTTAQIFFSLICIVQLINLFIPDNIVNLLPLARPINVRFAF